MNGDFRDGYCALPMSNTTAQPRVGGDLLSRRGGARAAEPDDRDRRGRFEAAVRRAARDRRRRRPSTAQHREFRAREIILCAGALQTPAMLMRAGIGPADHLRALGIDCAGRLARRRTQSAKPPGAVHRRAPAARMRGSSRACARCRSRASGCRPACATARRPICSSTCRASRRGMRSASRSPTSARCCGSRSHAAACRSTARRMSTPLVEFNFVSDERDLARLKHGFRWTAELLASADVRGLIGTPFPVRFTDRLRRLNQKTRANAWKASVVARLLNLSPALERLRPAHADRRRAFARRTRRRRRAAFRTCASQRRRHVSCERHVPDGRARRSATPSSIPPAACTASPACASPTHR